jgi:hypothetical protein
MRIKILTATLAAFCVFALGGTAAAHVLIRDKSAKLGAELHISPDDDPVAGKESVLYFSIESKVANFNPDKYTRTIQITDDAGFKDVALVKWNKQTLYVSYTFPHTGVYSLRMTLEENSAGIDAPTYEFNYNLRVSRGLSGGANDSNASLSAEIGFIILVCLLISLRIFSHDRKQRAVQGLIDNAKKFKKGK